MSRFPRVTDHALLRYLERVRGFDVAAIRAHISELCAAGASVHALCVKAEGVQFELDRNSGAVLTVTPLNGGMPSQTKKRVLGA